MSEVRLTVKKEEVCGTFSLFNNQKNGGKFKSCKSAHPVVWYELGANTDFTFRLIISDTTPSRKGGFFYREEIDNLSLNEVYDYIKKDGIKNRWMTLSNNIDCYKKLS